MSEISLNQPQVDIESIDDPRFGIKIYRSVLPSYITDTETIDNAMSIGKLKNVSWVPALVGDYEEKKDYRDCFDCKLRKSELDNASEEYAPMARLLNDLIAFKKACVDHYTSQYGILMDYIEAVNFVKYGLGQHFQVHADHGFSYSCSVSTVGYLNDNFEGGATQFPKINKKFKPKKYSGILFYPMNKNGDKCHENSLHAGMPITKGQKYIANVWIRDKKYR
jgi:hypothetical protein